MTHRRPLLSLAIAAAALWASCAAPTPPKAPESPAAVDDRAVRFETRKISAASDGCDTPGAPCARVTVVMADAVGGGGPEVRENLDMYGRHWVVTRLREHLPDGIGDRTGAIDELVAAFLANHRVFTAEFPDASADWFVDVEVAPLYSSPRVATLDLSITTYTGGAHPNAQRQLVSFATDSGQLLGADDLTGDVEALTAVVERRFRKQRGLGPDDGLEAAGFWFPDGRFTLPDNLGVVANGVLVHWNAYEIAPYSMGPTTVEVPKEDLDGIVRPDLW